MDQHLNARLRLVQLLRDREPLLVESPSPEISRDGGQVGIAE